MARASVLAATTTRARGRSRRVPVSRSQRVHADARIRIRPAIDPVAVRALVPQAVELALDAGVGRDVALERARVARLARCGGSAARHAAAPAARAAAEV